MASLDEALQVHGGLKAVVQRMVEAGKLNHAGMLRELRKMAPEAKAPKCPDTIRNWLTYWATQDEAARAVGGASETGG